MDFYTALSTYYDEIFAVSQSDLDFIDGCIPTEGRVLDVGCGTGNKTVLLKNAASDTAKSCTMIVSLTDTSVSCL